MGKYKNLNRSSKKVWKCRKCNNEIPLWTMVNGKRKNFQNRKFCLECSPLGCHNTNSNNPDAISKRTSNYKNWTKQVRRKHIEKIAQKGKEKKQKAVDLLGGACKICGYNKCLAALCFHHRNPALKEMPLTVATLRAYSWEIIEAELAKCDLLCVRCHAEWHDKMGR